MRRWFLAQPIHRKLMVTSMVQTTAVLLAAMIILLALDAWRYQRNASAAAGALAAMMAENLRVALMIEDKPAVLDTLRAIRVQPSVERACAYLASGTQFSQFVREGAAACPAAPPTELRWRTLGSLAVAEQDGERVGSVYVELAWTPMQARLIAAGIASLFVLILAAGATLVVSNRVNRGISGPITQLAIAARQMGRGGDQTVPRADDAPHDEVADLVRAFDAMVERVSNALAREQQANRVKDEFLATVSHELRTPLNAIVGWASILTTSSPDPDTVAKAAASMYRNGLAQARVIDDLIDISRIVTGKLTVVSEPVDLRTVVGGAVESIQPPARQAGVTFTVTLPPDPCVINGDRDRLQQVVWNLLSNAVKFAPRSLVTVSLTPAPDSFTLVVSDTGIGITREFIAHIFDRFRQADASTTREHAGLGLGLTIAKDLVELHGGTIRAESGGRGEGATFTVTFPTATVHPTVDRAADDMPSLRNVSVLAVDDNLDALELLESTLTQAGAQVRLASSGADAVELWRQAPSDVLLCDLAMPRMSGFEVLAVIRDLDRTAGRVTPAIAVTAHATEEHVARSAQAGFQIHVAKPFDPSRLVRAVSAARSRM